ncbi:hypothetical protein Nepgr_027944 [Nepenthes gracilis]|uniref:Uncharacterized protein n=1 Tax=Nepenthes gracilis TaxID=150966 RepID=A0AAD3Y431_NEPGR|nr:hypothetical protein Nepgr_027944 [Nepenthes gracilis]
MCDTLSPALKQNSISRVFIIRAKSEVDPPLGGGDSSLRREGPSPKGENLAGTIPGVGDWGALSGSFDNSEVCGTSIEVDRVKVGSVGAGAPTGAEDFTGDCAEDLLAIGVKLE